MKIYLVKMEGNGWTDYDSHWVSSDKACARAAELEVAHLLAIEQRKSELPAKRLEGMKPFDEEHFVRDWGHWEIEVIETND